MFGKILIRIPIFKIRYSSTSNRFRVLKMNSNWNNIEYLCRTHSNRKYHVHMYVTMKMYVRVFQKWIPFFMFLTQKCSQKNKEKLINIFFKFTLRVSELVTNMVVSQLDGVKMETFGSLGAVRLIRNIFWYFPLYLLTLTYILKLNKR